MTLTQTPTLKFNDLSLIFAPSVHLIGHSQVNEEGLRDFLAEEDAPDWHTDTDLPAQVLPEVAGRVCYMSYSKPRPGGNAAYLRNIVETGHHSVLEHTQWTFAVTGISRSLSHELVRHRHLSPSQLSQRYVDESACRFVVPPFIHEEVAKFVNAYNSGRVVWEDDPCVGDIWLRTLEFTRDNYCLLVDKLSQKVAAEFPDLPRTEARKMARQTARSLLPNATETKIVITGNARAWRHFTGLRANTHAEDEIRILALAIFKKMQETAPNIFYDFEPRTHPASGKTELTTPNIF